MMKLTSYLICVNDINASRKFYEEVLGQKIMFDFGANIAFESGLALQTKPSWMKFINKAENEIIFGSNCAELYFEELDFDSFVLKLKSYANIDYLHDVVEYPWGQRVIRFYDIDRHIIEVGENMEYVIRRFLQQGMTIEQTAAKTQHPISLVNKVFSDLNI